MLNKELPIQSTTILVEDLPKIYKRLLGHVNEEANLVIADLTNITNQTDDEFESFKENARVKAFKITVTIKTAGGTILFGDDASLFDSDSLPDNISMIYMTNRTAFTRFAESEPLNYFELWLDFTKAPLLDARNPVSHPTSNDSRLHIVGSRDSWVASIEYAIFDFLKTRHNRRGWLHRGHVYDIGLLLVGLPFAFHICYRLWPYIENYVEPIHNIVSGAMYVYFVFCSLWIYRFIFEYIRWIFPNVELLDVSSAPVKHRFILSMILLGAVGDVLINGFG